MSKPEEEEEEDIIISPHSETQNLVPSNATNPSSSNDPTIDPLSTGFQWYKPPPLTSQTIGKHQYTISGHDMQILTTTLPPHSHLTTEVGTFMYMNPSVKTEVELTCCPPSTEGMNRMLGGESCVKVHLRNEGDEEGFVGLTPNFPAKVIPIRFGEHVRVNRSVIARGGAIMSQLGDDIKVGCDLDCGCTTCCCAGLGCCRQKIEDVGGSTGEAIAFLAAGGTLLQKDLDEGEMVVVDSNSVVAFEDSVKLGVAYSGGCGVCCLGGEGLCNTTLSGPGRVWIQSMSFEKFKGQVQETVYEDAGEGGDGGFDLDFGDF